MPKFNELIEMLKVHEGVETYAYKCSENKTTIGVGRNVDKNGGLGLSDDEVDYLLQNDINRIILELDSEYSWYSDLDDVRQNAMIDISFNLGQTRLRAFKRHLQLCLRVIGMKPQISLWILDGRNK